MCVYLFANCTLGSIFLWQRVLRVHQANIDILINAAGISQRSRIGITNADTAQQIINTNLNATIELCRLFSRFVFRRTQKSVRKTQPKSMDTSESVLIDSGDEAAANPNSEFDRPSRLHGHVSPCIINISSLLGVRGGAGATAYAASKAGVLGFTRALVCENAGVAKDMRVNAIVPGYIDTPMTKCKSVQEATYFSALSVSFSQSSFILLLCSQSFIFFPIFPFGPPRFAFVSNDPFHAPILNTLHNVHLRADTLHIHVHTTWLSFQPLPR